MNTVLTLAGTASGGLINILLVLVLVVAAILLIIAVYLIRSSRRSVSKHAYEPQVAQYHVQDAPYQDADFVASDNQSEGWQQRPVISQPLTVPDALKQCPFCGTDVSLEVFFVSIVVSVCRYPRRPDHHFQLASQTRRRRNQN